MQVRNDRILMSNQTKIRVAHIAFIECEIRGGFYNEEIIKGIEFGSGQERYYRVWQEPAEVYLVRPDGLRRNFSFKNESIIVIHNGMIEFSQNNLISEFTVDEDAKAGKPSKTKLDFT